MKQRAAVIIFVAVALFMIATTIKSGWLYLVSSFLLSLVVINLFSGLRTARKLSFERKAPSEIFEGERLPVELSVINNSKRARHLVAVRELHGFPPDKRLIERLKEDRARRRIDGKGGDLDGSSRVEYDLGIERIARGEKIDAAYTIPSGTRGIYSEAWLSINSAGLFGSIEVSRKVKLVSDLVVYPRIFKIDQLPFHRLGMSSSEKVMESSRKGSGLDYFGVREYVHGDSLRHIHWRSSARLGQLIVREYEQEIFSHPAVMVLLGQPGGDDPVENSLEDGLRIAASILSCLEREGSIPRLFIPGDVSFEAVEDRGGHECMRALAAYKAPGNDGEGPAGLLEEGIDFTYRILTPGTPVVVITNISPDLLLSFLYPSPAMEDVSLVLVDDDSYRGKESTEGRRDRTDELARKAAGLQLGFYRFKKGQELDDCLKGPSKITVA